MIKHTPPNLHPPLPAHWQPLIIAVENGANLVLVRRSKRRFDLPERRPFITLIGDDLHDAQGPEAFDVKSL
jgi:hypothetical protein